MRRRSIGVSLVFLAAVVAPRLAAGVEREGAAGFPVPLSPGSLSAAIASDSACPTFSWGRVDGAEELELLVLSLSEGVSPLLAGEMPSSFALRQQLPGGATSWTPSADRCLSVGEYAWLIRVPEAEADPAPWSRARLFSVDAPTPIESLDRLITELEDLLAEAQADPEIADALRTLLSGEKVSFRKSLGLESAAATLGPPAGTEEEPAIIIEPEISALRVEQVSSTGTFKAAVDGRIVGASSGPAQFGVFGHTVTTLGSGVRGEGEYASGVVGASALGDGVQGYANGSSGSVIGVRGQSNSPSGYGGFFFNGTNGIALEARGFGKTRNKAALRVQNLQTNQGMATYMTNDSTFATGHFGNAGAGQVLWLTNGGTNTGGSGGGDFIVGLPLAENDAQFRILSTGEMRSDVGFNTPAADFAEMLPAAEGLEAGDVLIIGEDGRLELSRRAFEARVAGVYSTRPGFTGGLPVDGPIEGEVPLAIVGIVPVKASAEGGEIRPGDLLVTARTPGRVMRARRVRRDGVIVGKALSGLESGIGEIRILVMLQ